MAFEPSTPRNKPNVRELTALAVHYTAALAGDHGKHACGLFASQREAAFFPAWMSLPRPAAPDLRAFHDAVTGGCQADGVSSEPSRTGVCVIRITAQGSRMFITLRENADVERIPADRMCNMSDVDEAVQAVHEFLTSFVAASRAD